MRVPQHFTNIQHALQLSRKFLATQATPNRQIILITDGLPTAHFEDHMLYLLYPPDERTENATMREAQLCAREGITINIFLLQSWSQSSEDVQFAYRHGRIDQGTRLLHRRARPGSLRRLGLRQPQAADHFVKPRLPPDGPSLLPPALRQARLASSAKAIVRASTIGRPINVNAQASPTTIAARSSSLAPSASSRAASSLANPTIRTMTIGRNRAPANSHSSSRRRFTRRVSVLKIPRGSSIVARTVIPQSPQWVSIHCRIAAQRFLVRVGGNAPSRPRSRLHGPLCSQFDLSERQTTIEGTAVGVSLRGPERPQTPRQTMSRESHTFG